MRLRGVEYRRIQAGPTFGLGFTEKPGHAWFHFIAVGNAVLRMDDGTTYELSAGNAVFISHGAAHQLLSHADAAVLDIDRLDGAPLGDSISAVATGADASPTPSTILFSGCMEFELGSIHGLGKLMPGLMLIDAGGQRYPGLVPILTTMEREVSAARVGFAGILARLADVVAAMVVRGWVECACGNASGLVAALRDPRLAGAGRQVRQQTGAGLGHHFFLCAVLGAGGSQVGVVVHRFLVDADQVGFGGQGRFSCPDHSIGRTRHGKSQ